VTPLETEAVFAAIGLQPILDAKPRLAKRAFSDAAAQSARVKRTLLRFLSSDAWAEAEDLPEFDYQKTLKQLQPFEARPDKTNWLSPTQVNALFAVVPDKELATDLVGMAETIMQWANPIIPKGEPDPVTGQVTEDPPYGDLLDFRRGWAVACDPMSVLRDLADGSLFDDQVETLVKLFPATYQDIQGSALAYALPTMVQRRGKTWKPGPTKAALLACLLQKTGFDPQLAQMVQAADAANEAANQQQVPQKAARPRPKASDANAEATPGQKAAAG
jgi:hypothetical protein